MEYSKEFKKALGEFTHTEKDRLIVRLLKKDKILSQKLYFELIDPETQDDKRDQMIEFVKEEMTTAAKYVRNAKYFLGQIRKISAKITEHVKITTDKFGDVSLNLLLVNETLQHSDKIRDGYKLYIYLLNKIFKILIQAQKLDEDYHLELQEDFQTLRKLISQNDQFAHLSILHGLDLSWLDAYEIPEHISLIQKEIKSQGFLR